MTSLPVPRDRRIPHASLILATIFLLSGCFASVIEQPISGYTCCNLRASKPGWISSNNLQRGDFIPAGEPIKLESVKKQFYVYGTVGGRNYGLRDDSARTQEDTMRWIQRVVVPTDPRQQLAGWPTEVRTAVGAGRVVMGMTRDQIAMAIGHPSSKDTPDLAASTWRYWTPADNAPVVLRFADDGRLLELIGSPAATRLLELQR